MFDVTKHRDEVAAMVLELQANRAILFGLTDWFSVFVFTGGHVPTAPWRLAATTFYLQHPWAGDGCAVPEMQRYRGLLQTISDLGQTGSGPRTLKCRRSMGNRFAAAASELRRVEDAMELSMTKMTEAI